jgi:hypothetical protein
MYSLCHEHELPELWAYLWEGWYRPSRWELWARSAGDLVPRLKTTMICEAQYVSYFSMLLYSTISQLAAHQGRLLEALPQSPP